MKGFLFSIIVSITVSILSFIIGRLLSVPVLLYEIEEHSGPVYFNIKNVGLIPADRTKFNLIFVNNINNEPVIKKQYWTTNQDLNSFLVISNDSSGGKVKYDDNGSIDEFEAGEELALVFLPLQPRKLNEIKAHDIDITKSTQAFVIEVDNIDILEKAIKWGIPAGFLILMSYTFLGYIFAKTKIKSKRQKGVTT